MYICLCSGVTEREIRACAQEGACTLRDLECCLGVGANCGRCRAAANAILSESRSASAPDFAAAGAL
jgi:bacterioferritin-associated ferredoxin